MSSSPAPSSMSISFLTSLLRKAGAAAGAGHDFPRALVTVSAAPLRRHSLDASAPRPSPARRFSLDAVPASSQPSAGVPREAQGPTEERSAQALCTRLDQLRDLAKHTRLWPDLKGWVDRFDPQVDRVQQCARASQDPLLRDEVAMLHAKLDACLLHCRQRLLDLTFSPRSDSCASPSERAQEKLLGWRASVVAARDFDGAVARLNQAHADVTPADLHAAFKRLSQFVATDGDLRPALVREMEAVRAKVQALTAHAPLVAGTPADAAGRTERRELLQRMADAISGRSRESVLVCGMLLDPDVASFEAVRARLNDRAAEPGLQDVEQAWRAFQVYALHYPGALHGEEALRATREALQLRSTPEACRSFVEAVAGVIAHYPAPRLPHHRVVRDPSVPVAWSDAKRQVESVRPLDLSDGSRVYCRALHRADVRLVNELLDGSSDRSLDWRYPGAAGDRKALAEHQVLRSETPLPEQHISALLALDGPGHDAKAVALVQWSRHPERQATIEVGMVVADALRGKALGPRLLREVADALPAGWRLGGIIDASNQRSLQMMKKLGATLSPPDGQGKVWAELALPLSAEREQPGPGAPAASGDQG